MTYPFKKILCPVDFDHNSIAALDAAAEMARQNRRRARSPPCDTNHG